MRIKYVISSLSIISPPDGCGHSQKQQGLPWSLRTSQTISPQFISLQLLCLNFWREQCCLWQQQHSPGMQAAAKSQTPESLPALSPSFTNSPHAHLAQWGNTCYKKEAANDTYSCPSHQSQRPKQNLIVKIWQKPPRKSWAKTQASPHRGKARNSLLLILAFLSCWWRFPLMIETENASYLLSQSVLQLRRQCMS